MTSSTTPNLESNVGVRFAPTEQELLYSLKQKILGNDHLVTRIPQLDIYGKFDPCDLPWKDSNDRERYFFSPLHAMNPYKNNGKINRSTKTGSWQATGKNRTIPSEDNGEETTGIRKIFVHSCIKDGIMYVMHEYSLPNLSTDMVVCKVMKKKPKKKSEGSRKKVKKTENDKAEVPYNNDNFSSTPASDEDSDIEKWINYNDLVDQCADSTCDNAGGTNFLAASDSVNHDTELTIQGKVDLETLPNLQSFPGYNQQDYNPYFTLNDDQPLMITEQFHTNNSFAVGTSMSEQDQEDSFSGLGPLWVI